MGRLVGWWITGARRAALTLCVSAAVGQPSALHGQAPDASFMDFDALTSAVRGLEGDLVDVSSLATTDAGNPAAGSSSRVPSSRVPSSQVRVYRTFSPT